MPNDASIIIRLTKKEKATLQKLALLEGKNMTDYIKSRVFIVEQESTKKTDKLSSSQDKSEQYLDMISRVVIANNAILRKTIAKDFTDQDKESLKNEINERLTKLFEVK